MEARNESEERKENIRERRGNRGKIRQLGRYWKREARSDGYGEESEERKVRGR